MRRARWEVAERLVADEVARVSSRHGNAAIFGGSYGWASAGRFHHAQSQLHRFLNLCGGYTRSVNTHSYAAAEVLLPHVLGDHAGLEGGHTSWGVIAAHTRLFVAFGGVPLKNAQVSAGGIGRHDVRAHLRACCAAGTQFINIGPLRDDIDGEFAPEWLPVRPNTDTALMLALSHTLIADGLFDQGFIDRLRLRGLDLEHADIDHALNPRTTPPGFAQREVHVSGPARFANAALSRLRGRLVGQASCAKPCRALMRLSGICR